MDVGFGQLARRGLMTSDEWLTEAGRAFREESKCAHRALV